MDFETAKSGKNRRMEILQNARGAHLLPPLMKRNSAKISRFRSNNSMSSLGHHTFRFIPDF